MHSSCNYLCFPDDSTVSLSVVVITFAQHASCFNETSLIRCVGTGAGIYAGQLSRPSLGSQFWQEDNYLVVVLESARTHDGAFRLAPFGALPLFESRAP